MSKKILFTAVFLLALVLLLTSCKQDQAQKTTQTSVANPASVYCQSLGYTEEIRQNSSGQYGVCIFPDGSECNSWDFLAGRCGQGFSYCAQQGYTLNISEGNIALCVFDDGSTCNEYLYSQGECKPGENKP